MQDVAALDAADSKATTLGHGDGKRNSGCLLIHDSKNRV
jgi:hypothetical protein